MKLGIERVLVTGASGFVGGHIVRELNAHGLHAVCLIRDREKFVAKTRGLDERLITVVEGDLFGSALADAAGGTQACIHLVGIIMERARRGQTFERVHVEGTRRALEVARNAGVRRFVHMSALGSRPDAPSRYHRTKAAAEEDVRASGLDFTIFQPSLIHSPDGEFVRELLGRTLRRPLPPFLPFFGDGRRRLQPIYVDDLARVFVAALSKQEATGRTYPLGGSERLNWREVWETARAAIPGAKRWKPKLGIPLWWARPIGRLGDFLDRRLGTRLGIPFNLAQVLMSQEDSVCETDLIEGTFGVRLRDFRTTLAEYAEKIG